MLISCGKQEMFVALAPPCCSLLEKYDQSAAKSGPTVVITKIGWGPGSPAGLCVAPPPQSMQKPCPSNPQAPKLNGPEPQNPKPRSPASGLRTWVRGLASGLWVNLAVPTHA